MRNPYKVSRALAQTEENRQLAKAWDEGYRASTHRRTTNTGQDYGDRYLRKPGFIHPGALPPEYFG